MRRSWTATPYDETASVLDALHKEGVSLGVLADPRKVPRRAIYEVLRKTGIIDYFDERLILYRTRRGFRIYETAALTAEKVRWGQDAAPVIAVVVTEDATERALAKAAGLLSAPHPLLALPVLQGRPLRYVRIRIPSELAEDEWRARLSAVRVVPLYVTREPMAGGQVVVYAVTDVATAAQLDGKGYRIDRLGGENEPQLTDLYLLVGHEQEGDGTPHPVPGEVTESLAARRVVASTEEGLFVALPGGWSGTNFSGRPDARHYHGMKLIGARALLKPPGPALLMYDALPATGSAKGAALLSSGPEPGAIRRNVDADKLKKLVQRYSSLPSRDINFPKKNNRAVSMLESDLNEASDRLVVRKHSFTHLDRALDNVVATLDGTLDGIVILCAHLDSFAKPEQGSDLAKRAPGADDNASGLAAVVSAAAALAELAGTGEAHREIRFVLFNSEEYQLAGSVEYVRDCEAQHDRIVCAFNMDMIGFDAAPPAMVEIHCGSPVHPIVQERSFKLAELVAALAVLEPELPLQPKLYPASLGGTDPAHGWSDQFSFHTSSIPACLVCEEFWTNVAAGTASMDHDRYHTPNDTVTHDDYAAAVARVVTAAAWIAATSS
ncbi:MAG TPA: M28 family peptidase [Longimicrobiaceae bacterium]